MNTIIQRIFFISFLFLLSYHNSLSQNLDSIKVTGAYNNESLEKVLQEIGEKNNLRFYMKKEWVEGITISTTVNETPLSIFLKSVLENHSLSFILYNPYTIVIIKNVPNPRIDSYVLINPKDKPKAVRKIITPNSAKRELKLSGRIVENNTLKPLPASIHIVDFDKTIIADEAGNYSTILPRGIYTINIRYLGYIQEQIKIDLRSDFKIDAQLIQEDIELKEVVVEAKDDSKNITSIQMSVNNLSINEMKKMPAFLGEVDVIKSITLLPGVTTVGEGATGFNVRGGSVDQNLVLMDGAPLFNSSHFFGFFSVFSPDMVRDVTLYKGGIPAQYGTRISSVLTSDYLSGDYSKYHLKAGIGPIISKLSIEGPIIKNKLSFIVGGRAAYPNWILRRIPNVQVRNSSAWFYDINGKLSYQVNDKNLITYSGYLSKDNFKLENDSIYSWTNFINTIKWKHIFNKNVTSYISALVSNYDFKVAYDKLPNTFELNNGARYIEVKAEVEINNHSNNIITSGISIGNYKISPGKLSTNEISSIINKQLEDENAIETGIYINDEYKINEQLTLLAGLRLSSFFAFGKSFQYNYLTGSTKEVKTISDTTSYKNLELIKPFYGIEPRVAINFKPNLSNSIKLSYNRIKQYIHLISNTTAITPLDIWKISDTYTSPSIADHFGLGYFKNFNENSFETSVEVYYKRLTDLVDYKDGAELVLNDKIETELITGKGRAYGIELMLKKNSGKLTGWTSYSYSRTERRVIGAFPEETINFGEYFYANYDKPHDIKIIANYQLKKRLSTSFNFNYSTGRPITAPESKYIINGVVIPNYLYRNNARIPDYHRLDISITYEGNNKRVRKYENSITFSVYNVYGRKNPYSVFYKHEVDQAPGAYRFAVLGSPIPSITYNIKF